MEMIRAKPIVATFAMFKYKFSVERRSEQTSAKIVCEKACHISLIFSDRAVQISRRMAPQQYSIYNL